MMRIPPVHCLNEQKVIEIQHSIGLVAAVNIVLRWRYNNAPLEVTFGFRRLKVQAMQTV